ncbi:uncharacterized protein LOC128667456 [Microplitis demolitor]|uniref:uncharacterized protein LOC128667456 n=1 Tax=Microplitis demolitor TaxID=69319 RepID=UPI00235B62B1|nr:uncharacterized protein LOC128667456 [Microplitis demolitor]
MLREISYHILTLDKNNSELTIRQCVDKYEILLKCCKKVQKIYGPIILWTMNVNAIVLCAVIFQLSHSEKFRECIYAANWVGNNRMKSSIIIMLAQKPLILTACNLLHVTIDMFVKVINTTVSCYLLLKTHIP